MTNLMKKRHPHKNNILLVNITRLGDMLQATPTIAGMKMENPDAKITVLVEKQFDAVCHTIPYVDEVMSVDLGMTVRSLSREKEGIIDAFEYISELVEDLRSKNFDYCLNMSSSAYTALLLSLVGIENRGGWTADEEGYRVIESEWARLFATSVFHQNRQYNSLNLVDVFRCSADVEMHPNQLQISVQDEDIEYCQNFIEEANFTNTGPFVVIQAGASQSKRQWSPELFVRLINILVNDHNARIVLSGSAKELPLIELIHMAAAKGNVAVAAGKTNIPQLTALLKLSDILITGDTGPMHISVAAGTPVISMFLASAFGFETGPYSEGNIILQPVLECAPCNPNKPCARPDCHINITPELIAKLTVMRLEGDFKELPMELARPQEVIIYRSFFDKWGFCDLEALNSSRYDKLKTYRDAYRKLWLDDLGGFPVEEDLSTSQDKSGNGLAVVNNSLEGLSEVIDAACHGVKLIEGLKQLIIDTTAPASKLGEINQRLGELDRKIEQLGYHFAYLGPLTRMFIFAKENLSGREALDLACQMGKVYNDLKRRGEKLQKYYSN